MQYYTWDNDEEIPYWYYYKPHQTKYDITFINLTSPWNNQA